jgi:hypothetical protein
MIHDFPVIARSIGDEAIQPFPEMDPQPASIEAILYCHVSIYDASSQ